MQHVEQKLKRDEDSPREDRDPECCTAPPSGRRFFFSGAPAWVRWRKRAEGVGRGGGRRGKGTSCSRPAPTLVSKLKWHLSATFNRQLAKLQLQFLTFLEVKGQRLTTSRKTFQEHTLINRHLSCIVTIYSTIEHNSCCWIFKSGCSGPSSFIIFFFPPANASWNDFYFFLNEKTEFSFTATISPVFSLFLASISARPGLSLFEWQVRLSWQSLVINHIEWNYPNLLIRGESLSNQKRPAWSHMVAKSYIHMRLIFVSSCWFTL